MCSESKINTLYPYKPKEFGIPFEKILNGPREREVKIHSGGGNLLSCYITDRSLEITDPLLKEFGLTAVVNKSGLASFTITTETPSQGKHIDMFASHFVKLALTYFEQQGNKIHCCKGNWKGDSISLKQFWSKKRKTKNNIIAAQNTWSGKLFRKLGFTQISEDDVIIQPNKEVIAYFRKPSEKQIKTDTTT